MKILTEHIELEFLGGTDIDDAITKAKLEANRFNFPVKFEFNSVEIIIKPGCTKSNLTIGELYYVELYKPRRVEV